MHALATAVACSLFAQLAEAAAHSHMLMVAEQFTHLQGLATWHCPGDIWTWQIARAASEPSSHKHFWLLSCLQAAAGMWATPALQCPRCLCRQAHAWWTSHLVGMGRQHHDHLRQVGIELERGGDWHLQ